MKVTVCFGPTRVVVPCGDGYITVRDLIRQATLRYKKATGKSADSWVAVQSVQTSDGGILDPDDRLTDVVDDREQIVATFSDADGPHHGGGDGASGSSVGTGSPDIFQGDGKYYPKPSDIEVTSDQLLSNALQVRRGSEPALNQLDGPIGAPGCVTCPPETNQAKKRWSAAPVIIDFHDSTAPNVKNGSKLNGYSQGEWACQEEDEEEDKTSLAPSKFQRDGSNRLSMQFLPDEVGLKWVERASHVRGDSNRSAHSSLQRDHKRREPLGQANSYNSMPSRNYEYVTEEGNVENLVGLNTEYIVLRNEGGPLGIHVVPDYDADGRDRGLLVQNIEPGGRVHKDGRLGIYDRIIEINGSNLLNEPFLKVQEIFKNSLSCGELRLRVVKHKSSAPSFHSRQPPAPVYPVESSKENMVEGHQRSINSTAKVATVSPTKKLLGASTAANILQAANTRKMGKRIDLELLKGPSGLGFSVTTRDNPAGGKCPIYIKNILPQGAAVDDGRLKPGDRLLMVNGIEMTGKSQPEAVAILRQAPTGSVVKISVSRQEDVTNCREESVDEKDSRDSKHERMVGEDTGTGRMTVANNEPEDVYGNESRSSTLDRTSHKMQKPPRNIDESHIFPWRHREILTFDIPVYDSEKAGLGVSVKGKTSANHSSGSGNNSNQPVDLGIFVKSVLNGGAASRDGRLKTNDQLLSVNGKSLLNQSNASAMETLRRAMLYIDGPKPGVISLTVARRVSSPGEREGSGYLTSSSETCRSDSDGVTPEQSVTSDASGSTVIYLPSRDNSLKFDRRSDSQLSSNSYRSQKYGSSRNPVIERLTGQNVGVPNNGLRNESYYRATHETTWNIANMVNPNSRGKLSSPTVNPGTVEPVLIEEDHQSGWKGVHIKGPYVSHQDNNKSLYSNLPVGGHGVPGVGDVTYASQSSLDESAAGFSRDGVGRQSMSEKRHATLDAKNTDTYRRNKKLREEKQQNSQPDVLKTGRISSRIAEIQQELLARSESGRRPDVGPGLGLKKSSSLESLQTMVQEVQIAEDPDPTYTYTNVQGGVKVIRKGRGCNESFRAAVDRSYDAPLGLRNPIDIPVSEDKVSRVSFENDGRSARGTPRHSSMNAMRNSKSKHNKKKFADSWVAVQSVQNSNNGILEPDDRLTDVVDDRERIVATFSNSNGPHLGGGDGASGSSVGTGSPDIFQGDGKYYPKPSDIEVTSDQLLSNALQVRRGSEPALNQLDGPIGAPGCVTSPPETNQAKKRWSAAPVIIDFHDSTAPNVKNGSKLNGYSQGEWACQEEDEEEDKTSLAPSKFQRDGSNRLSMQFLPDEVGLKWVERASHVRGDSNRSAHSSLQRDHKRREPLGQANSYNSMPSRNYEYVTEEGNVENLNTEYIVLRNEGGPLGIHVVPDYDADGKDRGLLVQNIEPGGRVHKDGRLGIYDRIIEINGSNLLNEPFLKVQEIFKNSLSCGELRLRVVKHKSSAPSFHSRQPPAPVYPVESSKENMVEGHQRSINSTAKVATVSPTKKLLGASTAANILQAANTRKMGKRIDLELLKGPSGLGFSVTTRDNPAGGKCPIYIKNILPQGAAVDDGRLKPGDRLLMVNGIEMTGKSQPEAVAILRQAPTGSVVKISVSRQEDVTNCREESVDEKDSRDSKHERMVGEDIGTGRMTVGNNELEDVYGNESRSSTLDRTSHKMQKPPRNIDESHIFPWRHREILTFDIPVYDSEKAGLGVSVKGKTSANHSSGSGSNSNQPVDLGIFVKSVLNGGAASRDGRLKTNDQLLSVNGKSLLNQSNASAMETLRRAMLYIDGPKPGVISLTVARRVSSPGEREGSGYLTSSSETCRSDSDGVTPEQSVTSDASGSTVIYLPSRDNSLKFDRRSDSQLSSNSYRSQKYGSSRNPVIERLTGQNVGVPNNGLRNESYYRATHETTWNIANMVNPNTRGKLSSPTVNPGTVEPVLIEEDHQSGWKGVHIKGPYVSHQDNNKSLYSNLPVGGHGVPGVGDVTYASQSSLDESAAGFSRDGVGRQSMSEKRHATLDAKNTDTYRRNKKLREEKQQNPHSDPLRSEKMNKIAEIRQELLAPGRVLVRAGSAESIALSLTNFNYGNESRRKVDVGPSLGLKKSSSLESLQTMVQEVQMAEDPDPAYTYRNSQGAVRVIRGRGCNESFRAAVDRSYDAPLGLRNHIDTSVSEDEGFFIAAENDEHNALERGTPRHSSMNAIRDPKLKHSKKKASLLKGIGSMFRFGKHRVSASFDRGTFSILKLKPIEENSLHLRPQSH